MDYNKLNIRFANFGWNIAHDPITVDFGRYIRLNNLISDIEGRLTSRPGLTAMSTTDIFPAPAPIIGVRKLNDSVQNESTYVIRAGSSLIVTTTGGVAITTTPPFDYTFITNGFSNQFGSIHLDQTARSAQVWAYIGDSSRMVKIAADPATSGIILKNVGINRPAGPITSLIAGGGGNMGADDYSYIYTYFDDNTGVESLFNRDTTVQTVTVGANGSVTITIPTDAGVDPAVTHVRIYRSSTTLTDYRLLTDSIIPYTGAATSVTDKASDTDIASATLADMVSDQPFVITDTAGDVHTAQPMQFLFGPIFGYMLACGDPANPGLVYWTKKFNPDAHDPDDFVQVTTPQDPLMGGLVYDGKPYVFSKEGLYNLVAGIGSSTFTPFKTSCGRGLFFTNGYAVGPEIYFVSKDGVYATSGGQERLLSGNEIRPLFEGQSIYGYSPVDFTSSGAFCRMAYYKREVYFQYRGQDGATYVLVYDLAYKRWRFTNYRIGTSSMYSDEEGISQLIFGSTGSLNGGRLFTNTGFDDETADLEVPPGVTTIPVRLTTQLITMGAPLIHKEFAALIIDLDPQGADVTISVYRDRGATLVNSIVVNDATRVREFMNLDNIYTEDLQIDIQWASSTVAPILYGYELLYRPDTIQLERWGIRGVTHGLQGWQMLRSGYITLRSDGDVTFQIVADGTAYNYTIPSTAGEKRKIFVPFDPIKGKVFDYYLQIDTATYFRLYNSQCEIHVKEWITSFGYKIMNPFIGANGQEGSNIILSDTNPQDTGIIGGGGGGTAGSPTSSNYLGTGGQPLAAPQVPAGVMPSTEEGGAAGMNPGGSGESGNGGGTGGGSPYQFSDL